MKIFGIWGVHMLTIVTALLYAGKHKALENRLVIGKKEKNVAKLFLISSGKAKRQLNGNMISDVISDKVLLCSAVVLDCLISFLIFLV